MFSGDTSAKAGSLQEVVLSIIMGHECAILRPGRPGYRRTRKCALDLGRFRPSGVDDESSGAGSHGYDTSWRRTMMSDELGALRGKLATEIPVTLHLGLEVIGHDAGGLTLAAPLSKNLNHQGTAFAGSVNAVATLAGWGWVWLTLRRSGLEGHVVLQDSTIQYLKPIDADFTATCLPAMDAEVERLLAGLTRHGRGRLALGVEIRSGATLVATFTGRYVALAGASAG